MRTLVALMTLSTLATIVGCQPSEICVLGIQVRNEGYIREPLGRLECEAAEKAVEFWKLRQFADSCYICEMGHNAGTDANKTIYEFRHVVLVVNPLHLNEADMLNGFEWKGNTRLTYSAIRSYSDHPGTTRPASGWSEWTGGGEFADEVTIEKRNGKWKAASQSSTKGNTFQNLDRSAILRIGHDANG